MGACVRGHCVERVTNMLPIGLQTPIIRLILKCFEDGNGTLEGVICATPTDTLMLFGGFLDNLKRSLDSNGEINGEYVEELVDDLNYSIRAELYWQGADGSLHRKTNRIIDELPLNI